MVVRVNRLGYKQGEEGYEETNDYKNSPSYDDEVLKAKEDRDKEDQLFNDLFSVIDKWNNEIPTITNENIKELKSRLNAQRINKRFFAYGSGNPENYWDFFEMFDFICFLRVRHPEFMATLLKDYKGGRFFK